MEKKKKKSYSGHVYEHNIPAVFAQPIRHKHSRYANNEYKESGVGAASVVSYNRTHAGMTSSKAYPPMRLVKLDIRS